MLICWETLKSVAMAMNFGVPLLGYMNTVDKRLSKQVKIDSLHKMMLL